MENNRIELAHDLLILEEMAANMAAYLDSDVIDWTIPHANMPRLTIGGYLMRQHRLLALRENLALEEQERLDTAVMRFNEALEERVVRYEKRAHQELHARIADWIGYLRDLGRREKTEVNHYAGIIDVRVVMKELLDSLGSAPYKLEDGVYEEVGALDQFLRNRLSDHAFIWAPMWQAAYPQHDYWWLYGSPRLL